MLRTHTADRLLAGLTPGRAFLLGAGLWTLAHLVVHLPSGWPFPVPGEWDVLLPASVFADGQVPQRWIAGLAPHEAASLVLSLLVAGPLALSLDPTVVARGFALGFGALAAGSLSLLAWHAAPAETEGDTARKGVAATATALLVATALPAWHSQIVALDGSTPEATALMLAGLALLAAPPRGIARTTGAGALLAFATMLSPVAAPGLAIGALLAGLRRVPHLALGGGLVLLGAIGLRAGLGDSVDWFSLAASAPSQTLGSDLVMLVPRALHAATAGLAPRGPGSVALGVLTWTTLVAAASLLRRSAPARVLGLAALGFLLLTLWTPDQYRAWPSAFRYWQPALLVSAAGAGAALAWMPRRWWGLALIPPLLFVLGPGRQGAPRAHTVADSLFATGVHKLGPDPWGDHALLAELAAHAPSDGAEGLLLGYGLLLGQKASAGGMEAPFVSDRWETLLASLPAEHAQALAIGVGYGLTAPCDPTAEQLRAIQRRPERNWVLYGAVRGLAARPAAVPSLRAYAADDDLDSWRAIGDALRAGGVSRSEAEAQPVGPGALSGIVTGHRQPGGGPWETQQMDELGRFQPPPSECPVATP